MRPYGSLFQPTPPWLTNCLPTRRFRASNWRVARSLGQARSSQPWRGTGPYRSVLRQRQSGQAHSLLEVLPVVRLQDEMVYPFFQSADLGFESVDLTLLALLIITSLEELCHLTLVVEEDGC